MSFEINQDVKITGNTEFGGTTDFNLNEAQEFVIETTSSTSFPAATPIGRLLYCTVTRNTHPPGIWVVENMSGVPLWQFLKSATSVNGLDPFARDNHTGTQLANTISNFDTQVRTSRLDQMAIPMASVNMNNQKITNVANPTADGDGVNYGFLKSKLQGLNPKQTAVVATTTNITLSGTQTVDGVALQVGDRVVVKNQTTTANNGIYVVASGSWTRSDDANAWEELVSAYVFIEKGNSNGDTGWLCTVDTGGSFGQAITWIQFTGVGEVSAGTGLSKVSNTFNANLDSQSMQIVTGNNIAVKPAPNLGLARSVDGLKVDFDVESLTIINSKLAAFLKSTGGLKKSAAGIEVEVDNSTIEISGNVLRVKAGGTARKYVATITGNGVATSFTVSHSFNTKDVVVAVRRNADDYEVYPLIVKDSVNTISVRFKPAPANGDSFTVTVIG
jgi:hypothetical protein